MSIKNVRAGKSQAELNEWAIGVLGIEILLISIATGILTKSWAIGGGTFLALIIISWIKTIYKIF